MIKPIMKDEAFLAIKSAPATKMDTQVAQDLKDTLRAHADKCVGMFTFLCHIANFFCLQS